MVITDISVLISIIGAVVIIICMGIMLASPVKKRRANILTLDWETIYEEVEIKKVAHGSVFLIDADGKETVLNMDCIVEYCQ